MRGCRVGPKGQPGKQKAPCRYIPLTVDSIKHAFWTTSLSCPLLRCMWLAWPGWLCLALPALS